MFFTLRLVCNLVCNVQHMHTEVLYTPQQTVKRRMASVITLQEHDIKKVLKFPLQKNYRDSQFSFSAIVNKLIFQREQIIEIKSLQIYKFCMRSKSKCSLCNNNNNDNNNNNSKKTCIHSERVLKWSYTKIPTILNFCKTNLQNLIHL